MEEREVKKLKEWFLSQRRDLPWRDNATPYAVWISEVMLQQTQVAVVIPYFQRWMERFPTIRALAESPIDDVLKEWEGLGYYARARNLHEGARYIVENYEGELPCTEEPLREIKGLGAYTVGAILNFAFHQRAAAVDGNVLRVLTRYYCLTDDICKAKTVKKIQGMTYDLLPEKEPWLVSEALIELGATLCSRTPKCIECPLKISCGGFLKGKVHELPVKSAKATTLSLFRTVAVVVCGDHILVGKGEKGKIMADLFEFPYFEIENAEIDLASQKKLVKKGLKMEVKWQKTLPQVKHSFTRYRALLVPHLYHVKEFTDVEGYEWHSMAAVKKLPFSSGHRRILTGLFA